MYKILWASLFLTVGFVNFAAAQMHITVGSVQRYFWEGDKKFQTLQVTNHDEKRAFEMKANLKLYANIRDRSRKEASLEDASGHFMLAPRRFVLEPGETRAVRLVRTLPFGDEEQVYSLAFQPQVINKNQSDNTKAKGIHTGATFVTVAGMLVLASPKNPLLELDYERDEEGITFTNKGNVAADLRLTKKYCYDSDIESGCMELPGKRVYPGNSWRFEIEDHIPLRWGYWGYNRDKKFLDIPAYDG